MSMVWAGRALSGFFAAFLLFASIAPKLSGAKAAIEPLGRLGWDIRYVFLIGCIELTCLVIYLIPRTSVLGAILTTALLGGAIATHLRVGSPLFSHTLFGLYLGLMMWGGLWLRDSRLHALLPIVGAR